MHAYMFFDWYTVVCILTLHAWYSCSVIHSHLILEDRMSWSWHRNAKAKMNQPKKKLMPKPPQACPGLTALYRFVRNGGSIWRWKVLTLLTSLDSIRLFQHPSTAQSFTFFIHFCLHFFCFWFNTQSCYMHWHVLICFGVVADLLRWTVLEQIWTAALRGVENLVTRPRHRTNFWAMERSNTRLLSMSIICPFSGPCDFWFSLET